MIAVIGTSHQPCWVAEAFTFLFFFDSRLLNCVHEQTHLIGSARFETTRLLHYLSFIVLLRHPPKAKWFLPSERWHSPLVAEAWPWQIQGTCVLGWSGP